MSKCPDAEEGEAMMAEVMQNVGHKVSLNFTYIATFLPLPDRTLTCRLQNSSGISFIECMHGPSECLGNRQQLWYSQLLPF
jgi:Gamma interferon inducible lysosomal thiol reductase (GILT)